MEQCRSMDIWTNISNIDYDFRKRELLSIGAVNVKKESGSYSANNKEVSEYQRQDKDFILQQLNIYDADLIICCGVNYPNADDTKWSTTKRGVWYGLDGNRVVISYVHPAVRCPANLIYYGLMDAIREIFETGVAK